MELIVWITLLAATLAFIGLGVYRPAESYYAIIGFSLLLYLGSILTGFQGQALTLKTGETIQTNYTYTGNVTNSTNTSITDFSSPIENTGFLGFFLVIIGALGLTITFFQLRTGGPQDD